MSLVDKVRDMQSVFRPSFNIGCLFDIPTGRYHLGKYGESILNGGLATVTGIGGRGNTHKSTTAHHMTITVLDRYPSEGIIYDTELSLSTHRLEMLSGATENLQDVIYDEFNRFKLLDKTMFSGNAFFDIYRSELMERRAKSTKLVKDTPFINSVGECMKAFPPLVAEVDSFSMLETDSVAKMYDKSEIGDGGLNMEAMKGAGAKSQMMTQLPGITASGGSNIILTAHVGDEHQLDPYAPPAKKLAFLKNKLKFKRVPENFTFLTNNLWFVVGVKTLIDSKTKTPIYPRRASANSVGDTDLMEIELINVRAKSGPSGSPIKVVVSQSRGLQPSLSEFRHIKTCRMKGNVGFGITGDSRKYHLDIYPEVTITRHSILSLIDKDAKLRRALNITSELRQILTQWEPLEDDLMCTPKELYGDLINMGYDWDILLACSREYWVFTEDEDKHPRHFLSTMDLLRMRKGLYVPTWYKKVEKQLKTKKGKK